MKYFFIFRGGVFKAKRLQIRHVALNRGGGCLKRYGFPIKKKMGTFSKFSSNMWDIFLFLGGGGCLKRYGAKISDFGLN